MKQYPDEKRLIVECECGCTAYDMRYWTDDLAPEIIMSVWKHGKPDRLWKIITGFKMMFGYDPYADNVILSKDEAVEMRNFLDGYIATANRKDS